MWLKDRKILAIDDTASIRTFLRLSMQAMGGSFFEAATASEGIAQAIKHRPDLIVLDLGLPDRDGLDILPTLKKIDCGGSSPMVVILSVRKEQRTKERAFALGADAYMSKPFLMEDLIDVIGKQMQGENSAVSSAL